MPLVLDATVGGAAANAYLDRTAADAYFEGRFGSEAWDALDPADKDKALVNATRHVDGVRFHGVKATSAQALEFPRSTQAEPVTEIPPEVRHATCEEALWIVQHASGGGRSDRQKLQADGVVSYRVGQLSETFGGSGAQAAELCPEAARLLRGWISRIASLVVEGRESSGDARPWWPFEP